MSASRQDSIRLAIKDFERVRGETGCSDEAAAVVVQAARIERLQRAISDLDASYDPPSLCSTLKEMVGHE